MAIIKVIEVIASSEKSFDDATKNALKEASKSVDNIQSIYVKEMNANVENGEIASYVENGEIASYAVNAKVSFKVNQ